MFHVLNFDHYYLSTIHQSNLLVLQKYFWSIKSQRYDPYSDINLILYSHMETHTSLTVTGLSICVLSTFFEKVVMCLLSLSRIFNLLDPIECITLNFQFV